MKRLLLLLLCLLGSRVANCQDDEAANQKTILNFINCVKNKKIELIANKITFPFLREYPLPEIHNKTEFYNRYNEIFDDTLLKHIINSNSKTDWTVMGWRGMMLFNGELWLDFDGRLRNISYQSKIEAQKRAQLIKEEKNTLHPSIRKYLCPLHIIETVKYRIRIDDLGKDNFRYCAWTINKPMSAAPDLVITNGKYIFDGSGGNHSYKFENKNFTYDVYIRVMGEENEAPATLTISKDNIIIQISQATILRK